MRLLHIHPRYYAGAISLLASLLLLAFTYALHRQSAMVADYDKRVVHSYEVLRLNRRLYIHALDVESGQRGYILTGAREFLAPYYEGQRTLDMDFANLLKAVQDNPQQSRYVEEAQKNITRMRTILANQITAYTRHGIAGLTKQDMVVAKNSMDQLRQSLDTVSTYELALLKDRIAGNQDAQERYQVTLFLGAALALGGLIGAAFLISLLQQRSAGAEAELHEFQERLRLLMAGIDDGVFDYLPARGEVTFSESYARLLGFVPNELAPTKEQLDQLIHPDDRDQWWNAVDSYARRENYALNVVLRLRQRDEHWCWILARGVGVWDKHGKLERLVGTHTDITQQKAQEEELRQLNQDLESFAYIASHDLRAPLVNLKGFSGEIEYALSEARPLILSCTASLTETERAKISEALEKDIPESLGFIKSSVAKMDVLTTAILDMSRIGKRELRPVPTDTYQIVRRCLDSLGYEINRQNITVECGELPIISSDPVMLEQIFGNILDNAVKYLDPARPGHISVSSQQQSGQIIFRIADNGRGIAERDRNKVFDIFRRAGNAGEVRGAGMGMAYVNATVRRLGGRIWFDSALGQGTTFTFSIPLRNAETPIKQ